RRVARRWVRSAVSISWPASGRSTRFEDEYGREPGPCVAYGYEAMASALGAIDRADDPLSRSSVVEAYFDGTERDSVLGTYSITEEGETTLDAPLAAYRVEDGEVLPAR
ncbi:MAG TPA: hypothetical protein VF056_13475, partial [Thermoleophilaceae bacterium]